MHIHPIALPHCHTSYHLVDLPYKKTRPFNYHISSDILLTPSNTPSHIPSPLSLPYSVTEALNAFSVEVLVAAKATPTNDAILAQLPQHTNFLQVPATAQKEG